MSEPLLNSLTDADVRRIVELVQTLEQSSFDYLQVESGALKITLGKGDLPAAAVPASAAPGALVESPTGAAPVAVASQPAPRADAHPGDGSIAIAAPMLGRFYIRPDPGAAPFVEVGSVVEPDTTVALIEVMKVFTAIPAGVAGVISEICVADGGFVEYGQTLFRLRAP